MNLGMPEMIFIFLIALVIFGPRKLPEIGKQLGKALTEFKRASNSFQAQLEEEVRQLEYQEQGTQTIQAPVPPAELAAERPAPPPGPVSYSASPGAPGVGSQPEAATHDA